MMAVAPALFLLLNLLPSFHSLNAYNSLNSFNGLNALVVDSSAQAPAVPPSHAPGMPLGGQTATQAPAASGLVFQLPAGWVSEKPSSSMRLAQATVAGKGGPAQFGIFYFGPGGGGTPKANIERWVDQIDKPLAPPGGETFTTHGLQVTWVEVAGTMKPTTVGMGPSTAQPGYRLLGAVVEGPNGPWYLKITGPDATVSAARGPFLQMLHALQAR
jgi:hypothetical protein